MQEASSRTCNVFFLIATLLLVAFATSCRLQVFSQEQAKRILRCGHPAQIAQIGKMSTRAQNMLFPNWL